MPRPITRNLDALRQRLKTTLGRRIAEAVKSYDAFSGAPPPDDAKGFTAHHAACRTALAHVDMLVKLARWAEGREAEAEGRPDDDVGRLIEEARSAIEGLDDDDEDA